tara:strand:+ start:92 stop:1108 length:1017 start_codon:yes stop_codon:yes gene_type:complete
MKLTLGDVRPTVAKMLSMASTDSRVVNYINEAQERLHYMGKWPDTYARYSVKNSNGTITWPRQLETIETVAIDNNPAVVRNEWFEFLESGVGLIDSTGLDSYTLIDRGTAACFSDIDTTAPDKKLRVYYNSADNGKSITLQGYQETGIWIRTTSGGKRVDGEVVTFDTSSDTADASTVTNATHYVDTTSKFSVLSAVQRDATTYNTWLYEIESTGTVTARLIAEYDPSETRPTYRRSLVAGLPDESTQTVTVVGKLRFTPAVNDADWMFINYEAAVKEMVMSIRKAENNLVQEAEAYELRALRLMDQQLAHYLGDGQVQVPRFQNSATYGGGGVANLQ